MSKKNLSYKQATTELEAILKELDSNETDVDDLILKVKRASELIQFCKEKLYAADSEIEKILDDMDKTPKK